jgi:serine/threonine protein kinase
LVDDDGRLVLADLGLALGPDDVRYTEVEEAIGSRHFTAPENESGLNDDIDQRPVDLYAFGKILWVLVTGRTVLARARQLEPHYRMAIVLDDPSLAPLDALCDRLLDRDPRSRLTDWIAIRSELAEIMSPQGGGAKGSRQDDSWSASASAGLQRFAALAGTRARAEARRREALLHDRWLAVTSAMQIRLGELMDSRLAELTDQAEDLRLAFGRSVGRRAKGD